MERMVSDPRNEKPVWYWLLLRVGTFTAVLLLLYILYFILGKL